MTAHTVEQQKQNYSRQLALHTFRQWNAVRETQLQDSKGTPKHEVGRPDREIMRAESTDDLTCGNNLKPEKADKKCLGGWRRIWDQYSFRVPRRSKDHRSLRSFVG